MNLRVTREAYQMAIGIVLLTAGAASAQDVKYNGRSRHRLLEDHTVQMGERRGQPSGSKLVDGQIRQAIDGQLAKKGFTKATTDASDSSSSCTRWPWIKEKQWNAIGGGIGFRMGGGMASASVCQLITLARSSSTSTTPARNSCSGAATPPRPSARAMTLRRIRSGWKKGAELEEFSAGREEAALDGHDDSWSTTNRAMTGPSGREPALHPGPAATPTWLRARRSKTGVDTMSDRDTLHRNVLPIPDRPRTGLITYDAKTLRRSIRRSTAAPAERRA